MQNHENNKSCNRSEEGTLHFSATQTDNDEKTVTSYQVSCHYVFDGETALLSYIEPENKDSKVLTRCRIIFTKDSLSIARTGDSQSTFRFSKTDLSPYMLSYKTPYGVLPFTVTPKSVQYEMSDSGCRAKIRYAMHNQSQTVFENTIQFEVTLCETN